MKKNVAIENDLQDGQDIPPPNSLLSPDPKKRMQAYKAPWCPRSISWCQSSGSISSASTGKFQYFLSSYTNGALSYLTTYSTVG